MDVFTKYITNCANKDNNYGTSKYACPLCPSILSEISLQSLPAYEEFLSKSLHSHFKYNSTIAHTILSDLILSHILSCGKLPIVNLPSIILSTLDIKLLISPEIKLKIPNLPLLQMQHNHSYSASKDHIWESYIQHVNKFFTQVYSNILNNPST